MVEGSPVIKPRGSKTSKGHPARVAFRLSGLLSSRWRGQRLVGAVFGYGETALLGLVAVREGGVLVMDRVV